MALVGETGEKRDIGGWSTLGQRTPCQMQASLQKVAVWRKPRGPGKRAQEAKLTDAGLLGQIGKTERPGGIVVDPAFRASYAIGRCRLAWCCHRFHCTHEQNKQGLVAAKGVTRAISCRYG